MGYWLQVPGECEERLSVSERRSICAVPAAEFDENPVRLTA
jgi:hypothetical protein